MIAKVNDREAILKQMSVDVGLMFAIKQISGESENDIISHFYELGVKLFKDSVERKRKTRKMPRTCDRTIKLLYKETKLQVKFRVYAWLDFAGYTSGDKVNIYMFLSWPLDVKIISGLDVEQMLVESGLGFSNSPLFVVEEPEQKLYKCLKSK
jgi:hypothetical protein